MFFESFRFEAKSPNLKLPRILSQKFDSGSGEQKTEKQDWFQCCFFENSNFF
jgi:hypothetical protein